jgi:hypothetical protein
MKLPAVAVTPCIVLALVEATVWADEPRPYFRDSPELLFDPDDEAGVVAAFKDWEIVRDLATPGTPIVEVNMAQGNLSPERLRLLAKLPHLRTFEAWHVRQVTDELAQSLANLRGLREVWLHGADVGADGLKRLGALRRLRSLKIVRSTVTDDALKEIRAFPQLEVLSLRDCTGLTDAGIKEIACLKQLRSLQLDGTPVTDAALKELVTLDRLESLALFDCQNLTGSGLKALARCRGLRQLNLACCEHLTDEGLRGLVGQKQLESVELRGCSKLTLEAVADLKRALPDCEIHGP